MLTPTVAAVKFDLPLTLEQKACSAKIDEGLKTFWNLVERMQHAAGASPKCVKRPGTQVVHSRVLAASAAAP